MRYQIFGRATGLRISEYALGTANFGSTPAAAGPDQAKTIFEEFVSAGGATFDSSSIYQDGEAEKMLGKLLGRERDDHVIVTKYGGTRNPVARAGATGNGRKVMIRSAEESLRRLKTDYIDVFMPHFPDGVTPIEEILAGFDDLARAGKIRHGGFSNFPAWRVAGAAVHADLAGRLGGQGLVTGIETEYSLAERTAERELLPMSEAHGLGVLFYSPLAGGLLTGKYRRGEQGRLSAQAQDADGEQRATVLDTVLRIADDLGTGPVQVALAWLRSRASESTTSMTPIVGPRTPAHLESYLAALGIELEDAHRKELDEAGDPQLGTPHDDVAKALAHGFDGDRNLLEPPTIPVS